MEPLLEFKIQVPRGKNTAHLASKIWRSEGIKTSSQSKHKEVFATDDDAPGDLGNWPNMW